MRWPPPNHSPLGSSSVAISAIARDGRSQAPGFTSKSRTNPEESFAHQHSERRRPAGEESPGSRSSGSSATPPPIFLRKIPLVSASFLSRIASSAARVSGDSLSLRSPTTKTRATATSPQRIVAATTSPVRASVTISSITASRQFASGGRLRRVRAARASTCAAPGRADFLGPTRRMSTRPSAESHRRLAPSTTVTDSALGAVTFSAPNHPGAGARGWS